MMSKLILVFIAGNEVNLDELTQYKLDDLEMNGSFDPTNGTAAANTTSTTQTLTIEKKSFPLPPKTAIWFPPLSSTHKQPLQPL